ncbi:glycosyltransferase family 4 protein [Haloferula sargassicola]
MNEDIQVLQIGARHQYAIPRIINELGRLDVLFTDSCGASKLGMVCSRIPRMFRPSKAARLAERSIRGVPPEKIKSCDAISLSELIWKRGGENSFDVLKRNLIRSKIASIAARRRIGKIPSIIYTFSREFQDYVEWSVSMGARSIVDVFINPQTAWILERDISGTMRKVYRDYLDLERISYERTVRNATLILCPSEFVARGVAEMFPDSEGKLEIVPYGSTMGQAQVRSGNETIEGRFLFVGREALRKGLDLIKEAIPKVKSTFPCAEVRIAGLNRGQLIDLFGCEPDGLTPLGNLDRNELENEYLQADAFILPSRSEGFASVIAEAACYGLPLLVSPQSGTPNIGGSGVIWLSTESSITVEEGMRTILMDRRRRDELAKSSRELAHYFSEEAWKARLEEALSKIA